MTAVWWKISLPTCRRRCAVKPSLGREFLRETLKYVRVVVQESRPRVCPVCRQQFAKLTPQHMARHGLDMKESYKKFPDLGFTRRARLVIQPSPEGLLQTGEVFGLYGSGGGILVLPTRLVLLA